jgi:hypothetical protein
MSAASYQAVSDDTLGDRVNVGSNKWALSVATLQGTKYLKDKKLND